MLNLARLGGYSDLHVHVHREARGRWVPHQQPHPPTDTPTLRRWQLTVHMQLTGTWLTQGPSVHMCVKHTHTHIWPSRVTHNGREEWGRHLVEHGEDAGTALSRVEPLQPLLLLPQPLGQPLLLQLMAGNL